MEVVAELTKDSLEKLLLSLDEDRDQAARRYETLRFGLVRFFEWRGCAFPEEHADEVIDRVAYRLEQGEEIGNIGQYAMGVARFFFLEIVKLRHKHEAALRQLPQEPVVEDSSAEEARLECIRRCLQSLSSENYEMVIAYYREDGGNKIVLRKKLAGQLGISPRALRMRLQRTRTGLARCVSDCLNQQNISLKK